MSDVVMNGHGGEIPPLHASRVFAGKRLVVVGGTGFLGKVWVSMLLRRFPDLDHVWLVVRPKADQSAEERFWAQIASSPPFDPIRDAHPGDATERFLRAKVTPVAGDIVEPLLGLDPQLVEDLRAAKIDAVVNVAGVVDFSPPLDEALEVNAFGVNNLVALARTLGARVMHTSTCYVAGYRAGLIEENDPREVPFPRAEGETWYGAACPKRTLERSHWDPQREIAECLDLVKQAKTRGDDAFRQSAFLDEAKFALEQRGEPARGKVLEQELAKVKRKFMKDQLIAAGTERALFWGWSNIYTYTKSIGEQALATSGLPFTIVRPAVIESSCTFPFPGWNEGINTSAPFLYMASKGQVQFPGGHDIHLDIIPVDMVASGMLIALAELLEGSQRPVYHLGASDSNPCAMPRYLELAGLYKRRQVFDGKRTKIFDLVSARFESLTIEKKQYEAHGSRRIAGALKGLGKVFGAASVGPLASVFKPAAKALAAAGKAEDRTADVMELFIPFVASCEWIFSCANTRAAIARLVPEDRALFQWEPEKIDWRLWMWDVHLPGLEKWVYPLIEEKTQRELKALRPYETLVDMLDEAAERHEHSVALQELGPEGLSRTTFREWSLASRAVAARLVEAGVEKGDRVVISARNQPAWPIAYFGILRAGAVAVPVDPALEADAFANVARAAKAKVALWDADVARRVDRAVRAAVPAVRAYDLAAFADADGVDDGLDTSLPAIAADDLASLIYTSGTTGEPKGVMLSHKNFCSLVAALAPVFELTSKDRILGVLPLHHTFEFTCGLLLPLSRGARVVYLDELTGDRVGEALKKARITGMVGVPALWQMLERRIVSQVKDRGPAASMAFDWALELNRMVGKTAGLNLGKLLFGPVHAALGGGPRFLISGGAALPRDTAKLFAGLGMPLSEGYGLTEAAPVLTVAKASPKLALGQVGKAIPGVEIKIDKPDATGVGEVLARGPNVMLGYEGNAEATSAAIDEQGWLHTGDLGRFDKRKQLVLVGRQKDVIVSANGENVYPDDVEARLGKVKGVKELAIVGLDDGRGGERVGCLAVVERSTASGAEPDVVETPRAERHERASRELKEAFGELAKATQPAVVHLVDADLPRTATRKVKRNEVRQILERLVAASAAPEADASGAVVSGVRHAVATIANKKPSEISASTNLKSDLGFDSLMALELAAALEAQIGKPLDQGRLAACERVGELEDVVRDAGGASVVEGAAIEREEAAPIEIPPVVAEVAKRWMGRVQMGFYEHAMKPRVTGRAFIPHNRNTIVASNHASHLDMGFVKYALGDYGDGIVSLAAQDYFFEGDRLRRAYFENLTNLAAFDRKNGLRQALRQAGDIIDQGKTVLLFPEGTRSPDGAVHEFKPIIGHLALAHEVDILPVYLGGTFDALPKGRSVPTKRAIVARIGPPLEVAELRRLTEGMRASAASRKVAELAHAAVIALRDGKVLDLKTIGRADEIAVKEHPLVTLFRELEAKYVAGSVEKPVTYYFTLGTENEAKWTLRIAPDGCQATIGKPAGSNADCVLKTTPEMFTRIVKEAYTPTPMEFMTGLVKSNDIALLQTFQKAFHLV